MSRTALLFGNRLWGLTGRLRAANLAGMARYCMQFTMRVTTLSTSNSYQKNPSGSRDGGGSPVADSRYRAISG
jgi:hypothetical protein